jgi:hypothetical protein
MQLTEHRRTASLAAAERAKRWPTEEIRAAGKVSEQ